MEINIAEFAKVPYLDKKVIGDRVVNLMPLWDGSTWQHWMPGPEGLINLSVTKVVQSDYVAKAAASESDLLVPFVDLMWQRASWPEICPIIRTICADFHNLSTSTAKLRHFHRTRDMLGSGVAASFAATEIEYITISAIGIFDHLQELISHLWDGRVFLLDLEAEKKRKSRKLPPKFSKLVLTNKESAKTAEEISSQYHLPPTLAAEYVKHIAFFEQLRKVRNKVVHGLGSLPTLFSTEKGFCIDPKLFPFDAFTVWDDRHRYNDNLVSILPWLAHIVFHTIDACSALMAAFGKEIEFPPEIAPGYHVFVRGVNNDAVIDLLRCHRGELIWWEESEAA